MDPRVGYARCAGFAPEDDEVQVLMRAVQLSDGIVREYSLAFPAVWSIGK